MLIPKDYTDLPDEIRSIAAMFDVMFDELYLVGGAVRDTILGKSTKDLDFITPSVTEDIEKVLLANKALRIHNEGAAYGTISAHLGEYDIQVTSYRTEEYKPGSRNPRIIKAADIDSDLSRRDFTINAVALSRSDLVDPYDGISDIKQGIIRAIGNPDVKFKEDPLRMVRAFRFVSTLGYEIEAHTLEALARNKDNLQIITSERIGQELKKLLAGKYWADALNEMSESGVINAIMKSLDFTYEINFDDVKHEFDKYSISELETMDVVERWLYLVRILDYAERAAGVTSSDIEALAEGLLIKSQVGKQIRNEVIASLKTETAKKYDESSLEERIHAAHRQLTILKSNDDPRYMIEEAKYYMLSGQANMRDLQYGAARKNFKKALETTEENYKFILGFQDEEKRKIKLRGLSSYYKARLQYYVSSIILDDKLYSKFMHSDKLSRYIQKELKPAHVSKESFKEIIDRGIAYVYRRGLHDISLESYYDFLNKKDISLPPDTLTRYMSNYIESVIRDPETPPAEKAKLYLLKANNAVTGKSKDEYGLEYYDPFIDSLYNKMLSQKTLSKFWTTYDNFSLAARIYKDITHRERRSWIGARKYYLTSASSLAHALTLAVTIEDKLSIAGRIVEDYENAGRGFEKNAQRYRVYKDWFTFVQALLATAYSNDPSSLSRLHLILRNSKSRAYVDVDEAYLAAQRQDIILKRSLLQDSFALIGDILKRNHAKDSIDSTIIKSIATLYDEKLLEPDHVFALFKNYISSDENQSIATDDLQIEDKMLVDKDASEIKQYLSGESETIEYKSSWKFNVNRYRVTQELTEDKAMKWEVVKNIAGLANKRGGVLLIGVEDDRTICGLEQTDFLLYENGNYLKIADRIDREIRNEIKNKLGSDVLAQLSMDALRYEGKTIIRIKIPIAKPDKPVIYNEDDREIYYVRSGKSTDDAGMMALLARK